MASKIVVNLDTSKENYLVAKCKQNDDLNLEASIFENGEALSLNNKEITIQALKANGKYIIQNTDIAKNNNKITAELKKDFTRVSGTTKIEIVLVEGGKQNTTFSFYLEVGRSVIDGTVESDDSITALEKLQEAAIEIGRINEETQTLIETSGAAKKEDVIKINASLEESASKISDLLHTPKLTLRNTGAKFGIKNSAGTTDYYVFSTFYHVYDVVANNTGAVYALATPLTGKTVQELFRSIDGGESWAKIGEVPVAIANGERAMYIYVEPFYETIYVFKCLNINANPQKYNLISYSTNGSTLTQLGVLDIGTKYCHSTAHNMDSCVSKDNNSRITMFAEYGKDDPYEYYVWKTIDKGVTWQKVFTKKGGNGVYGGGEIKHFHTMQVDPFTKDWWLSSGDIDGHCNIWRSQDEGVSWNLLFNDGQTTRLLGFVFEKNEIYYGMDSSNSATVPSQIYKINRADMSREVVGSTFMGLPVYSLTRTFFPKGFLIWTQWEKYGGSPTDIIVVEFFDYVLQKVVPVAVLDCKGLTDSYIGFAEASRFQCKLTGNIFTSMTYSLYNNVYGYNSNSLNTSAVIKANFTM